MKKLILSIIVVACCMSHVNAQLRFGVKGGVILDNFSFKDKTTEASKLSLKNSTGWQAGVLLQVKVPVIGIGVQPEVLYTMHKAKVNDSDNTIGYLEVPVNLQWGLSLPLLRPYVEIGPYFGYALNIKGDELKDKVEKTDWGIGFGVGLDVWKLQAGARYTLGLQDVGVKDLDMKNRSFRVSLGLLF